MIVTKMSLFVLFITLFDVSDGDSLMVRQEVSNVESSTTVSVNNNKVIADESEDRINVSVKADGSTLTDVPDISYEESEMIKKRTNLHNQKTVDKDKVRLLKIKYKRKSVKKSRKRKGIINSKTSNEPGDSLDVFNKVSTTEYILEEKENETPSKVDDGKDISKKTAERREIDDERDFENSKTKVERKENENPKRTDEEKNIDYLKKLAERREIENSKNAGAEKLSDERKETDDSKKSSVEGKYVDNSKRTDDIDYSKKPIERMEMDDRKRSDSRSAKEEKETAYKKMPNGGPEIGVSKARGSADVTNSVKKLQRKYIDGILKSNVVAKEDGNHLVVAKEDNEMEKMDSGKSHFILFLFFGLLFTIIGYVVFQKRKRLLGMLVEGRRGTRSRRSTGPKDTKVAYMAARTEDPEAGNSGSKYVY